ncbi:helix-turn-helix transcriptional regulator [Streptosporangium saharense]|uniref:helix-turn-helix transcriptional regulator n=1 Tax=Streptosporangium saharense TaxID=1706840 RepID=UPI0036BBD7D1
MRAARLMSLVLLLQARGGMTAAELSAELEVSERTVHRDVLALSEAGIPVYADRGRGGGYRLLDGYRTRLTGLDRAQAQALFLSGVPDALREMGLEEVGAVARLKASAALPPDVRDAQAGAAQRFHLDAPGWFARDRPPPESLLPLARAVWGDHPVTAVYRGTRRTLEPYGLVLKAGVWYVATRSVIHRVGRLSEVEVHTDRRFTRDPGFDLAAFWTGRAAEFARSLLTTRVTVRLSPEGLRALPVFADPAALNDALTSAGEPDERGWVTLSLPVESPEVAYSQIIRFGPEAEVLDPPSLRTRLAEAATRLHDLYGPA